MTIQHHINDDLLVAYAAGSRKLESFGCKPPGSLPHLPESP